MKNVILAEPSTLALLSLFFMVIFGIVALCGVIVISLAFLSRKARREAPKPSSSAASAQTTLKNCPKCGASMPPDSLEGLCPRCLIALNLATQTEIPGEPGAAKTPPGPPAPVADVAKLFPQLEILECLGRGGMDAVYKARQPRLDRVVALKILSPEKQGNQKFSDRFEREARALAKLHHPNIVTVYDFGEMEGNFYLLMEFVDGLTLRQLLQTRKLAPPEALTIVPKICEALQYAHEQGIVHRDIKPENILMDKDGRVKIADFGIAKILGDGGNSNLTAEQVIGTPHYMSPEQIEKPQTVDHRADIYSLGVVFYEMLTGELPLGKFPPPSKKVQVDVRLDEIVLRALEKEPERRYQQASEVKTRIETITASMPEIEVKSKRMTFAWRAAAICLLLVGAIVALILVHRHLAQRGVTLTEAEFWQKFNSGQVAQATIIMNPMVDAEESTVVTITGKYYEAGKDGKLILENGKPVEDPFTTPNVMLAQSMSEKLLTSNKIDVVVSNPMLSDLGYQFLFFLFIIGIMLLLGTIIFFIQRARRNGLNNTTPEGSRQNSLASFIITMSRFASLGAAVLIIIAMVISLNSRSSHRSRSENVAIKSNPAAHESNPVTSSISPPALLQAQSPVLTTSQITALQKIITESQVQLVQRQAQLAQLSAMNNAQLRQQLPDIAKDSALYRLLQKLDDVQLQLTVMTNRLSPTNPDVLAQNAQIDMINRQIDDRITGIMISLKTQIDAQQTSLTNLEQKLSSSGPENSSPLTYNWTYMPTNTPASDNDSILIEQPPVVVETFPVSGAGDVTPGDIEIRVRFSKDMADGSWSWSTAWENSVPESLGPPHYLNDHRTCVIKVRLEPGKTYVWWLNSNQFRGFTDIAGQPSVPYLFSFQTKSN